MNQSQPPSDSRRMLAAIVFTDAVDFSALASSDEATALSHIQTDFDFMTASCFTHGGEVVKNTGDGLLMIFPSAVDAVKCSLDIQANFHTTNSKLDHRIGVHLGDVVSKKGDVFGDGVNVAARLMSLAGAGQIYVSQSVLELVGNKIPFTSRSLGKKDLKNIADPIIVHQLSQPSDSNPIHKPKKKFRLPATTGLIATTVIVTAAILFGLRGLFLPQAPASEKDKQQASNGFFADRQGKNPNPRAIQNNPAITKTNNTIQEAVSKYDFATAYSAIDSLPRSQQAQYAPLKNRLDNLTSLMAWLQLELQEATPTNPIAVNGRYAGTDYEIQACIEDTEIMIHENGEKRTSDLSEMAPWKVRLLALGALEQVDDSNYYLIVADWILQFSEQYDLPIPTAEIKKGLSLG